MMSSKKLSAAVLLPTLCVFVGVAQFASMHSRIAQLEQSHKDLTDHIRRLQSSQHDLPTVPQGNLQTAASSMPSMPSMSPGMMPSMSPGMMPSMSPGMMPGMGPEISNGYCASPGRVM